MPKQNIPTPKTQLTDEQQQWLDSALKQTRYCHYFTVSIADKTSPIGYHPSRSSEKFYTVDEAKQHKAELEQQYPDRDYIVTSGSTYADELVFNFSRWALLHKQRIEQLLIGGEA
ncbi:hypothetical protein [Acinetobacter rathckeae]|uniref:hypothetical protein n=1 Tax=Acinetobacter rathckeae TaxID=2605272 RepID=UPI0018A2E14E|nr:hypothetical protein [Acinetobacter rathckeae]MBF7694550.1 hypothetical protein [Acinetobacter rathckeae]